MIVVLFSFHAKAGERTRQMELYRLIDANYSSGVVLECSESLELKREIRYLFIPKVPSDLWRNFGMLYSDAREFSSNDWGKAITKELVNNKKRSVYSRTAVNYDNDRLVYTISSYTKKPEKSLRITTCAYSRVY